MYSSSDSDIAGLESMKHAMQNMVDNAIEQEDNRKRKSELYKSLAGRRFRHASPTNIRYFEIRGYDAERDMVLTKAYPKEGEPFDDEIEERYLAGAFEVGEYVAIKENPAVGGAHMMVIHNPYADLKDWGARERKPVFNGSCCNRCKHRFGTTSNKGWCCEHWMNFRCHRFKLET